MGRQRRKSAQILSTIEQRRLKLEEEIVKAKDNDKAICIEMDFNCKLGNKIIKGDPNELSSNGELLLAITER